MAPEQARGEPIDQRADLFSLGCVLYILCTGKAPFSKRGTLAVLRSVIDEVPVSPRAINPEVPGWLDGVINRLMAKNAAERIQSASEVAEILGRQVVPPPQAVVDTSEFRPLKLDQLAAGKRYRLRPLAMAAALLAVAGLGLTESSGVTQLGATLIRVLTPDGTLSIGVDDPNVKVSIEGDAGIVITGAGPQEVRLRPGNYRLNATRDGKLLKDDLITITRGGKQVVTINRGASESRSAIAQNRTLHGHVGRVWSVAFLPDGRRAVSCGDDGTVRLWDLQTERILRQFQHGARLSCVAVTSDGRFALSAGRNPVIKVWDLETGTETHSLEGHDAPVQAVLISRDGRLVLSCGDDNTIRLWDFATRAEKRCFRGHTEFVRSIAFLPDGRRAVSGSYDKTVRLWDLESGSELRRYHGYTDMVNSVAVSPDGRRIVSGGMDATIRLWDLESGALLRSILVPCIIRWVAFSPDGRRFLSSGRDWAMHLWDVEGSKALHTFEGHGNEVSCATFSPDGRSVLSGSFDETIRLWQLPP